MLGIKATNKNTLGYGIKKLRKAYGNNISAKSSKTVVDKNGVATKDLGSGLFVTNTGKSTILETKGTKSDNIKLLSILEEDGKYKQKRTYNTDKRKFRIRENGLFKIDLNYTMKESNFFSDIARKFKNVGVKFTKPTFLNKFLPEKSVFITL